MRLNLGCGNTLLSGYVNVDAQRPRWLSDDKDPEFRKLEVEDLLDAFPPESIEEIRCDMLIEHLLPEGIPGFLYRCWQLLVPGGTLNLLTINLSSLCEDILQYGDAGTYDRTALEAAGRILFNGFVGMRIGDAHKSPVTREYLRDLLVNEGFQEPEFHVLGSRDYGLRVLTTKIGHVDRFALFEVEESPSDT